MRSTAQSLLAVLVAGVPLFVTPATATNYDLVKEYAGSTFFNDWTFYDHFDNLTNGDTVFVSASVAASAKLAFVDSATNHAIIKVDNTSTVPFNEKRNTVRITTNDRYGIGSVWVADMLHIPYGCSVWPAWWSQSPSWPVGGEIDTLEGVNLVTHNQMGLHTESGCTVVNPVQPASSVQISKDCSNLTNNNQGCLVSDGNTASYGQGFAAAGGGVWVTELATSGISIWFFPRANVPSSINSNTKAIDTSTLGTPTGNWPATGCKMEQFFAPQNLIFDITLCGDFAGAPSIYPQTCSGVCYQDNVIGNGSNYANAYFEVASVRVYSSNGTNNVVKGGSSSGSGSTGTTNGNGTNTPGGNGALATQQSTMVLVLALGVGAVALLFA